MPAHPLSGVRTTTDPMQRSIECPECAWRGKVWRRNVPGGALASVSKLRGMLSTHIRDAHPVVAREIGIGDRLAGAFGDYVLARAAASSDVVLRTSTNGGDPVVTWDLMSPAMRSAVRRDFERDRALDRARRR